MTTTNGTKPQSKDDVFFLPESPASANVKVVSAAGFEWQITLRDFEMSKLMGKVKNLEAYFADNGYTPAIRAGHKNTSQAQANDAPPVCEFHGPMKRSKKFGGWFCPSKMGDGSYCKSKIED